jgi:hypothetical protein
VRHICRSGCTQATLPYEAQKVVYAVAGYTVFNFTRTKSCAPAHSLMAPTMVRQPHGRHSEHGSGPAQTTATPIINPCNIERLIPSTIAYMQTVVQGIMEPGDNGITYGEQEDKENDRAGGGTYRYHAIHPPVVEEHGEDAAEPGRPASSEPSPERKADCTIGRQLLSHVTRQQPFLHLPLNLWRKLSPADRMRRMGNKNI